MKKICIIVAFIFTAVNSFAQKDTISTVNTKLDTVLVINTTTQTIFTYPVKTTQVIIKPYKDQPIPPPPPPSSGYLSLPQGSAQTYSNRSNFIVENLQFTNSSGNILRLDNCTNVTIRNCYFGKSSGEAISIQGGSNITIEKNLFANNRTAIYVVQTTGNVKVIGNQFVNPKGPVPRGQYVQYNQCTGPGNLIQGNRGECFKGENGIEDLVNVFRSSGTAASLFTIRDNIFRGGSTTSNSSGGITTGDYGSSFVFVENNTLVNPGQTGMAAAGGTNITFNSNKVFATQEANNNVGAYAWSQGGVPCGNITFTNNRIHYINKSGALSNFWNGGNCNPCNCQQPTDITLAEMNVPADLINFVTPAELADIRKGIK